MQAEPSIAQYEDIMSTARVHVCREFLINIIEQQHNLIKGLESKYHKGNIK